MTIQTVQAKIDADAGRGQPRVVVGGLEGDAVIPAHCSVDLKGCKVGRLSAPPGTVVSVEGGSVESWDLDGAQAVFRDASVSGDGAARGGARVEYENVDAGGEVSLDAALLVSRTSRFSGAGEAVFVQAGGKWRSASDVFSGGAVFRAVGRRADVRMVDPTVTAELLLSMDDGAEAYLDGGSYAVENAGTVDGDGTQLEVRNFSDFSATVALFQQSGRSRVAVRSGARLIGSGVGLSASGLGEMEVSDVTDLRFDGGGPAFILLDGAQLDVRCWGALVATGPLLGLGTGRCSAKFAGSGTVRAARGGWLGGGARLVVEGASEFRTTDGLFSLDLGAAAEFVDLGVLADGGDGFSASGGSQVRLAGIQAVAVAKLATLASRPIFVLEDCPSISATDSEAVTGSGGGRLVVVRCPSVQASGAFAGLSGSWAVSISGSLTVAAGAALTVSDPSGGASVSISGSSLRSTGPTCVSLTGADLAASGSALANDGSRTCLTARPASGSSPADLKLSRCDLDGIDAEHCSFDLFAVSLRKYRFSECDVSARRCHQTGSQSAADSVFSGSVLLDRMCEWEASVHADPGAVLHHWRPKPHGNWVTNDAVVRVEAAAKQGAVGFASGGGSRGTLAEAAGWDPDTVAAGASKNDAFVLSCMSGAPAYSGQGAAVVLSGACPTAGSLNTVRVKWDSIKILDSRDCYEELTNLIVRHSPTDIQDSAAGNFWAHGLTVLVQSDGVLTLQGTSILEIS